MYTGRLRHRVIIQENTTTSLGGAEWDNAWTTSATVWANVRVFKYFENYDNTKEQQENYYEVTMRNRTLSNSNRLLYKSKILHIEGVADITEREKMLKVTCREEVGN